MCKLTNTAQCQFGCGILKMVDPKMLDFCPNQHAQRIFLNNPMMNYGSSKSAEIILSKINRFFQKKNHLRKSI